MASFVDLIRGLVDDGEELKASARFRLGKLIAKGGMGLPDNKAALVYGTYTMSVYMLSIPGGMMADNILGSRLAVLIGGIIIAAGHFSMAVPGDFTFYLGLVLIVLGTGLLKPNISAMVGQLYRPGDARRDAGFSIFYMGINLGAFIAPLATGFLAQHSSFKALLVGWGFNPVHSWHWGFGAAGVGMTLGMWVYIRRLDWVRHVGDAPAEDLPRPWGRLGWVALGTVALLALMMQSDEHAWLAYGIYSLPVLVVLYFGLLRPDEEGKRIAAIGIFFIAAMVAFTLAVV